MASREGVQELAIIGQLLVGGVVETRLFAIDQRERGILHPYGGNGAGYIVGGVCAAIVVLEPARRGGAYPDISKDGEFVTDCS